jgi:site-specific recombinase XerD
MTISDENRARFEGLGTAEVRHELGVGSCDTCLENSVSKLRSGLRSKMRALRTQGQRRKACSERSCDYAKDTPTGFARMGIARMIERAGQAAKLPFPVHVHMLRHSTGYALANRGMDTRRLQHFLGHASITNTVRYTAMSPEPFKDIWR